LSDLSKSEKGSHMRVLIISVLMLLLSACSDARHGTEENYGAQIGIVNHTSAYIYATAVDGTSGGHAHEYSAGVGSMCCVELPHTWRPGLKFEVSWDVPIGTQHVWKSRVVEVEKYDRPGSLYLHFFPDDSVRIVVTTWAGGSGNHPIAPPHKP
jgi:hypothetical protein